MTEFEYERGRLVRAVTTVESRWTEQDRAEALALTLYRASLCPGGCGQLVSESTSHWETGPEFDATSTTCRACAALVDAQNAKADEKQSNPYGRARLWTVTKIKA